LIAQFILEKQKRPWLARAFENLRCTRCQDVMKEGMMYTSILVPTDGPELAEKAVQHGTGSVSSTPAEACRQNSCRRKRLASHAKWSRSSMSIPIRQSRYRRVEHGGHGISAIVLGSETLKVLTHSKIPVLVYR
jgi:hypothetical protein